MRIAGFVLGVARKIASAGRIYASKWRVRKTVATWPAFRFAYVLFVACVGAALVLADGPVAQGLAGLPRPVVAVARVVTDFGLASYMLVLAAAVALACLLARDRGAGRRVDAGLAVVEERAAYVFASVAVAGIAAQIVKHIIGRARPRFIDTLGPYHFQFLDFHASRNSFPSGHAANAFAAAMALALLWPRGRLWLFLAASLIGASRTMVHAHYVSDVAFGALLGVGSAYGVAWMFAARGLAVRQRGGGFMTRGRRCTAALFRALRETFRRRESPRHP